MSTTPSNGFSAAIEASAESPADANAAARPTAHVIALGELPELAENGERVLATPANLLHQVTVRLQVSVGEVAITVGELLAAQQHRVLVLDRAVDQPVDVLLEGRVVARGQLVAVDDRFAIRITQLPVPLKT